MAYKRNRRGGRKTNVKKAVRANNRARQYNAPAKVASVVSLAKSVNRLKTKMRRETELKEFESGLLSTTVGQVNINNTGMYIDDLDLMDIAEGASDKTRIGKKVMLKGVQVRLQFSHQSNTSSASNYIIEVYKTQDFGSTLTAIRDALYNVDSISGVIDYSSTHKNEAKSWLKRVAYKRIRLPVDTFTGVNMVKDVKMFIKQNQELTYTLGSTQVPQNYRYIICIRSSVGNNNATTASTLTTVVHTTALTGAIVRLVSKCWYTDN
ncbi:hypothetical protein [Circovirus-like genome DHCV-3]|uniref:hypothetical protein n=1 Tax=Circovirus-like genome DHCV-3 TaxID=1788452 RepID=UPI0007F99D04|nr:hypothetical protein [Circovirus-like genome DHCV-3]AMB43003.1 hypothetical protein [Circovirus-like genome DHCV-3]